MKGRRVLRGMVALVAALALGLAGWWWTLLHAASDNPQDADVRVYLASDGGWTALRAAVASGSINTGPVAVSRPASVATNPVYAACQLPNVHCFTPEPETTRGEASAFARLAREQGWHSATVLTHQTHAPRTRWLFTSCFGPEVNVQVVATRASPAVLLAELVHETGGWIKVALEGPCR